FAAGKAPGREAAAVGDDAAAYVGQKLELPDDPVAAVEFARAARAATKRVATDAHRIRGLEGLDGRVERVGHVRVDAAQSVRGGPRAHTPGNRLVVSEGFARARIGASETQVVHGAGAGGGNAVRQRSGEGPQQDVHDALGSLNVTCGHGGGRSRVHHASHGGTHLDRRHQAGRGGNVFAEQTAEDVENRRGRNGEHRVHAASAGGRRSGEVHRGALAANADRDAQAHRT